ncbi:MAG: glycoside hydrolase [Bacteroidetes bacterium]|nr:glycoside hydrolase [Bacteroidota bacterium]
MNAERTPTHAIACVRPPATVLPCLLVLLTLLSPLPSCTGQTVRRPAIIAYVHGGATDIEKYRIEELTHLNYCFLHLNGTKLTVDNSADSAEIHRMVALKSRNPGLKVNLSFGGWGGCEPCSDTFSSPEARHDFAQSTKELLQFFGADGVDLDWEYPAIEGYPGHRFAPEDKRNFTALVTELRAVLGTDYEVSFAAGGFPAYLREAVEWDLVIPLVDWVNVMTYDLVNGYSTTTGHHTALFSTPGQLESTDYAVRLLDSLGVPRRKIVIGAAFYARVWEEVDGSNNGLFQEGKFKRYVRFRQLDAFLDSEGTFTVFWDSTAQAPYAYDPANRLYATFDDRRSVSL